MPPAVNPFSQVLERIGFTELLPGEDDDEPAQTVCIPYVTQSNLEALRYWARDHQRRGLEPDMDLFDLDMADQYLLQMQLEAEEKKLLASDTPTPPDKFKDPKKFRMWSKAFETYLTRLIGVCDPEK